jgi:predicted Zn-dependent protease
LKAAPDDASVANDLGLCYARQGKFDQAIEHLEKAVALQPERELYRNNIATVLVEMGRTNEAVAQVAAVYGEPIAHYNVGILLQQQGKREQSIEQLSLAVRQDPAMEQAREWLARLQAEVAPREQLAEVQPVETIDDGSQNQPASHAQRVDTTEAVSARTSRRADRVAARPPMNTAAQAVPMTSRPPVTTNSSAPSPVATPAAPAVATTDEAAAPPATAQAATPAASATEANAGDTPAPTSTYVPPSRY